MQLCDACGACRETEWHVCPFCRADLAPIVAPVVTQNERFDAMAAAGEGNEVDVLPSPVERVPDVEPDSGLVTAADLAHLTGGAGPESNPWDSPPPPPATPLVSDDDETVSKLVVVPLIAAAIIAVIFVAYSIVTQSPPDRPDAVALIDRTTTTVAPTTTEAVPRTDTGGATPIGVDLAEQAARLCRGDQFMIARAVAPSAAVFNDIVVAEQDGRDDWVGSAEQVTLRSPVPPLIGCLQTADAGEIDRCPAASGVISRRAVTWTYRVLRSIDGSELGSDSGVAREVRPCDELEIVAGGENYGSWSSLPQDRFVAAGAPFTSIPHPQEACRAAANRTHDAEPDAVDGEPEAPAPSLVPAVGRSLHATVWGSPATDHPLPEGWMATDDRPAQAVMCLIPTADLGQLQPIGRRNADAEADPAEAPSAGCPITAVVIASDGEWIGQWEYLAPRCPLPREPAVPNSWLTEEVGPTLGYALAESESELESSPEGE